VIKFIYFDVGGVVVDDFSGNDGWKQFRTDLGVTTAMDDEFMEIFYRYEDEVLVGRDVETLLPILREKFGLNIKNNYSLLEGFLKNFSENKYIWPIINRVETKSRIGLLTNMYPGMLTAMNDKGILPKNNWQVIVDSTIEMLKKPDVKLFEVAEKKAGVTGNEILFIDNTVGHIEAAKAFGWNVYHYDSSNHQESCKKLEQFLSIQGFV